MFRTSKLHCWFTSYGNFAEYVVWHRKWSARSLQSGLFSRLLVFSQLDRSLHETRVWRYIAGVFCIAIDIREEFDSNNKMDLTGPRNRFFVSLNNLILPKFLCCCFEKQPFLRDSWTSFVSVLSNTSCSK